MNWEQRGKPEDDAWRQGFAAKLRGMPKTEAPEFSALHLDDRCEWLAGYEAAERHTPPADEAHTSKNW